MLFRFLFLFVGGVSTATLAAMVVVLGGAVGVLGFVPNDV